VGTAVGCKGVGCIEGMFPPHCEGSEKGLCPLHKFFLKFLAEIVHSLFLMHSREI